MPLVTSAIWQQVPMAALDMRRGATASVQVEGVVGLADMAVAQRGAGANMSVDIAAGEAFVRGDNVTNQGLYYAYNDAVMNLATFSAAHATLPRVDRVALRLRDAFHGDAANDEAFVVVAGTATAGATLANLTGAAAVPDTTVRARSGGGGTELAYAELSAAVNVTATSEATATVVVTVPSVTFDGVGSAWVEFYAPLDTKGTTWIRYALYDGSTSVGLPTGQMTGNDLVNFKRRLTPSSGSHTYSVRAFVDSGTGVVSAQGGGAGNLMPIYLRVTRA